MRRLLFIISILSSTGFAGAQTTPVPDFNFRKVLIEKLPFCMRNGEIVDSLAAKYAGPLTCTFKGIGSLEGIQKFQKLTSLDCGFNLLSSIDETKNLKDLTFLACNNNWINKLPELGELTKLTYLNCSFNQLTVLPDLSKNTALTALNCFNTQISTIPGLDKLVNLEEVFIYANNISFLPDLSNLTKIKVFQCHYNKIPNLNGLGKLTELTTLVAGGNPYTTLPDISALTKLQIMMLWNSNIDTAPNTSNMADLTVVDFNNNHITKLWDLSKAINLKELRCQDNQLDSLPNLSNQKVLQKLHVSNNRLRSLPNLSAAKGTLDNFFVDENNLESLPNLSAFTTLDSVKVKGNLLTFEDLLPINAISTLKHFLYSPQKNVRIDSSQTAIEDERFVLTLGIDKTVTTNTYTWFKNGVQLSTSNNDTLVISKVSFADTGNYTCEIKNSVLTSLTLSTSPLKLKVRKCIDLSSLAYQTIDFDCNIGGAITINESSIVGGQKPFRFALKSESGKIHYPYNNTFGNLFEPSYQLEIVDKNNCVASTTIALKGKGSFDCKNYVIVSTDSGESGSLYIEDKGLAKIYDRNGTLVKNFSTPAVWDGSLNSGEILPGFYVIEVNGKQMNVTVIK